MCASSCRPCFPLNDICCLCPFFTLFCPFLFFSIVTSITFLVVITIFLLVKLVISNCDCTLLFNWLFFFLTLPLPSFSLLLLLPLFTLSLLFYSHFSFMIQICSLRSMWTSTSWIWIFSICPCQFCKLWPYLEMDTMQTFSHICLEMHIWMR